MTPRPRYSRGCHACRRMKVKCDEQKPQCKRCIRGGRKCPGFPEISNFLSMNSDFEQGSVPLFARHADAPFAKLPLLHGPASILRPSNDWEEQAKAFFFSNYVGTELVGTVPGHLHFLPALLKTNGHLPVLRDAMRSVSMASLANASRSSALQTYSHQLYGQALRSIRDAIVSYTVEDSSAIMVSMYLLQKREYLCGITSLSSTHNLGLSRLLQARTQANQAPLSTWETQVLYAFHAQIHLYSINDRPGTDNDSWMSTPSLSKLSLNIPSRLASFWAVLSQASSIPRQVRFLSNACTDGGAQLCKKLDEALRLDSELVRICREFAWVDPPEEKDVIISLAGRPKRATRLYVHSDVHRACYWMICWSSRVVLLRAILTGLASLIHAGISYNPPRSAAALRADLIEAAHSVARLVPFMLGEIDSLGRWTASGTETALGSYFSIYFLESLVLTSELSLEIRTWALDCLGNIGCRWGIGWALLVRHKYMHLYEDMNGKGKQTPSSITA